MIPESFKQDLLNRVDIVDVVSRYVQLKKGGANYLGLCPFHGEKSPSFTVSPAKQFYHCFGCGKNGNAIGFLMDYAGMGFIEAVKDLAGQYGMQVPEDDRSPADRAARSLTSSAGRRGRPGWPAVRPLPGSSSRRAPSGSRWPSHALRSRSSGRTAWWD